MMAFSEVVNMQYQMGVIQETYSLLADQEDDEKSGPKTEKETESRSVIDEILHGKSADKFSNRHAEDAIAMSQKFRTAASDISKKFGQMKELAAKAASGELTGEDLTAAQKDIEKLSKEINEIVETTEHKGNKLFTSEGEKITVSIGQGSSIEISGKDLSFDASGIDITQDPTAALEQISEALGEVEAFQEDLEFHGKRLESSSAIVEGRDESEEIDKDQAMEIAMAAAKTVLEEVSLLLGIQANVEPEDAAALLYEKLHQQEGSTQEETTDQEPAEDGNA